MGEQPASVAVLPRPEDIPVEAARPQPETDPWRDDPTARLREMEQTYPGINPNTEEGVAYGPGAASKYNLRDWEQFSVRRDGDKLRNGEHLDYRSGLQPRVLRERPVVGNFHGAEFLPPNDSDARHGAVRIPVGNGKGYVRIALPEGYLAAGRAGSATGNGNVVDAGTAPAGNETRRSSRAEGTPPPHVAATSRSELQKDSRGGRHRAGARQDATSARNEPAVTTPPPGQPETFRDGVGRRLQLSRYAVSPISAPIIRSAPAEQSARTPDRHHAPEPARTAPSSRPGIPTETSNVGDVVSANPSAEAQTNDFDVQPIQPVAAATEASRDEPEQTAASNANAREAGPIPPAPSHAERRQSFQPGIPADRRPTPKPGEYPTGFGWLSERGRRALAGAEVPAVGGNETNGQPVAATSEVGSQPIGAETNPVANETAEAPEPPNEVIENLKLLLKDFPAHENLRQARTNYAQKVADYAREKVAVERFVVTGKTRERFKNAEVALQEAHSELLRSHGAFQAEIDTAFDEANADNTNEGRRQTGRIIDLGVRIKEAEALRSVTAARGGDVTTLDAQLQSLRGEYGAARGDLETALGTEGRAREYLNEYRDRYRTVDTLLQATALRDQVEQAMTRERYGNSSKVSRVFNKLVDTLRERPQLRMALGLTGTVLTVAGHATLNPGLTAAGMGVKALTGGLGVYTTALGAGDMANNYITRDRAITVTNSAGNANPHDISNYLEASVRGSRARRRGKFVGAFLAVAMAAAPFVTSAVEHANHAAAAHSANGGAPPTHPTATAGHSHTALAPKGEGLHQVTTSDIHTAAQPTPSLTPVDGNTLPWTHAMGADHLNLSNPSVRSAIEGKMHASFIPDPTGHGIAGVHMGGQDYMGNGYVNSLVDAYSNTLS